jgi:hypothetical protein
MNIVITRERYMLSFCSSARSSTLSFRPGSTCRGKAEQPRVENKAGLLRLLCTNQSLKAEYVTHKYL